MKKLNTLLAIILVALVPAMASASPAVVTVKEDSFPVCADPASAEVLYSAMKTSPEHFFQSLSEMVGLGRCTIAPIGTGLNVVLWGERTSSVTYHNGRFMVLETALTAFIAASLD